MPAQLTAPFDILAFALGRNGSQIAVLSGGGDHALAIAGFICIARIGSENSHVKDYEVYLSDEGKEWSSPVAKGSFAAGADAETVRFVKLNSTRYLKFAALNEQKGSDFVSIAELEIISAMWVGKRMTKT